MTRRTCLEAALAGVALAAAVTWSAWPLPARLGSGFILEGGPWEQADLLLVMWILAWGAHALATQPLAVFQANIFFPAPDALAASEHLLGLAPIAAPVLLVSGNPVLAHNVTVLVVVWLAALFAWGAVRAWTGSSLGGLVAGLAFALSPLVAFGWNRLHASAVHLFPLILLLAWRAAARPRLGLLAGLALAVALQVLTGVYVTFELIVLLAGFAPAVWWEARRHGRSGIAVAAATAVGLLALAPIAPAYLRVRAAGELYDFASLNLPTLAMPPSVLGPMLGRALGWPVVLLAAVGAATPRVPWHLRAGLVVTGGLGFLFALGHAVPGPYVLAERFVPGFSSMRAPVRFLVVPVLAGSLLAGIGGAALLGATGRVRPLAVGALVVAMGLLVWMRPPVAQVPIGPAPLAGPAGAVYDWLAIHGDGRPVLELPVVNSALDFPLLLDTGRYMLGSTRHWLPLINGYSGHPPSSDRLLMTLAQRLPDAEAFADLCDLAGPGWIVLHPGGPAPDDAEWRMAAPALGLREAARIGTDVVYRVERPCGSRIPALRRQLASDADGTTLTGLPRTPLPASARRGLVGAHPRRLLAAGFHTWFDVEVENASDRPWPGLSARPGGTVGLAVRWREPATGRVVFAGPWVPLARDLPPGGRMRAQAESHVPAEPGHYLLEIGLVQDDAWFADAAAGQGLIRRHVRVMPLPDLIERARRRGR